MFFTHALNFLFLPVRSAWLYLNWSRDLRLTPSLPDGEYCMWQKKFFLTATQTVSDQLHTILGNKLVISTQTNVQTRHNVEASGRTPQEERGDL